MAFDLGDLLKDVSKLDTDREQIEYIPLQNILRDPNNFYQLSDVAQLADNISFCGLQQPIRVRPLIAEPGKYIIVSGHRRREALQILEAEDPESWQEVPCIVERDTVSPALQQLRLIYANANTRVLTSAEIGEQAAQVEKLLYQLKEEGYDFPGRMRDHVAEAVGASKTKLARLKVIRENLDPVWADAYKAAQIGESVAYNLAQLPASWQNVIHTVYGEKPECLYADTVARSKVRFQTVSQIECPHGANLCEHSETMMRKNCKEMYFGPCSGCCCDCSNLQTCKDACILAWPKQKELRDTAKSANAEAKRERAERDAPVLEAIREIYQRIGYARTAAGVSVKDLYAAEGVYFAKGDELKQSTLEQEPEKINSTYQVVFGYSLRYEDIRLLIRVADLLNVSLDWLLGRDSQQQKNPKTKVSESDTWYTGDPEKAGTYIVALSDLRTGSRTSDEAEWTSQCGWTIWGEPLDPTEFRIYAWTTLPPEVESPLNASCKTGMSPTGHCGAAAACSSDANCCLNCGEDCNARCGWIREVQSNG